MRLLHGGDRGLERVSRASVDRCLWKRPRKSRCRCATFLELKKVSKALQRETGKHGQFVHRLLQRT